MRWAQYHQRNADAEVDNEYSQTAVTGAYFAQLEDQYRKNGIVVPLYVLSRVSDTSRADASTRYRTYNDPNMRKAFINGTGAVDIYGLVCHYGTGGRGGSF